MTKPQSTNKPPVDMPADNPEGTLDRFTEGLRRVLATPKPALARNDAKPSRKSHKQRS